MRPDSSYGRGHAACPVTDASPALSSERGAALVVSLIFLLILTLLGVGTLQTSILEERIAGNLRSKTLAFEAAEAAIRDAEAFIAGGNCDETAFVGAAASLFHSKFAPLEDAEDDRYAAISTAGQRVAVGRRAPDGDDLDLADDPRWVIEYVSPETFSEDPENRTEFYRIIALGYGGNMETVSVIESTYEFSCGAI